MRAALLAARIKRVAAVHGLDVRVRWQSFGQHPTNVAVLPLQVIPPTTVSDLERREEALAVSLRCALVEVVRDGDRADWCSIRVLRERLPPLTKLSSSKRDSILPVSAMQGLVLGIDLDGKTHILHLFGSSGASSLLIGGVPGSGKSYVIRLLLHQLSRTNAVLLFIDPAGGAEANQWAASLSETVASAEAAPTTALLEKVLALVELRGSLLAAGLHRNMLRPVVLIVDELAELGAASQPKEAEACRRHLRRIIALGRKANVAVILATQRTTATSIDVTTRALAANRLALAHPGDVYGSEALLGPGRRDAATLRKDDVGGGYLTDGGPPVLLRIFEAPEPPRLLGQSISLDELHRWDLAALGELRR